MMRTLKRMKKRLTESLGAALPLICLIAISGLSCTGLKPFPTKEIYEFDPKEPICAEYRVVDEENMKYEWVRDIPIKQCPALFGFKARQIPDILNWAEDAKTYVKEHCN